MREQNICAIQRWSNNASTQLVSDIGPLDVKISITPGSGKNFPDIHYNQYFLITVIDPNTCSYEIMKVIDKSDDSFTVIRGQEGTVPQPFSAGSLVELRLTAGTLENLRNLGLCCVEYTFIQSEPREVWEIQHNLGCYPNVLTFNEKDELIVGKVKYCDENKIQIYFGVPVKGKAYLTSSDISLRDKIVKILNLLNEIKEDYGGVMKKVDTTLCSIKDLLGHLAECYDITPEKLLELIQRVDGHGSKLDADTVDGLHADAFALKDLTNVDPSLLIEILKNSNLQISNADTVDGFHAEDLIEEACRRCGGGQPEVKVTDPLVEGPSQALTGTTIKLKAFGSTSNASDTIRYEWKLPDNTKRTTNEGEELEYTIPDDLANGTILTFMVRAIDGEGNYSGYTTHNVTVKINTSGEVTNPVVSGPQEVTAGELVTFRATGSTSSVEGGNPVVYHWTLPDGTESTGETVTWRVPQNAANGITYTIYVYAEDRYGNISNTVSYQVKVRNEGEVNSPQVSGPSTAKPGETVTLVASGSSSSIPGATITYIWTMPDGSTKTGASITYQIPSDAHQGDTLTFKVKARDNFGNESNEVSHTITVETTGTVTQPSIVGPATVKAGETITLTASGSTSSVPGAIITYEWTLPDNTTKTGNSITYHIPNDAQTGNTFRFIVIAKDNYGNQSLPAEKTVTVNNNTTVTAPVVSGPTEAYPGETITLTASGSTSEFGGITYHWTLPNGNTMIGSSISYTIPSAASSGTTYTFMVYAEDSKGNKSTTTSYTVRVKSGTVSAPTIDGPTTASVGETITLTASGSSSSIPGATITYHWTLPDGSIRVNSSVSYTVRDSDEGRTLTFRVYAEDNYGNRSTTVSHNVTVSEGFKITSVDYYRCKKVSDISKLENQDELNDLNNYEYVGHLSNSTVFSDGGVYAFKVNANKTISSANVSIEAISNDADEPVDGYLVQFGNGVRETNIKKIFAPYSAFTRDSGLPSFKLKFTVTSTSGETAEVEYTVKVQEVADIVVDLHDVNDNYFFSVPITEDSSNYIVGFNKYSYSANDWSYLKYYKIPKLSSFPSLWNSTTHSASAVEFSTTSKAVKIWGKALTNYYTGEYNDEPAAWVYNNGRLEYYPLLSSSNYADLVFCSENNNPSNLSGVLFSAIKSGGVLVQEYTNGHLDGNWKVDSVTYLLSDGVIVGSTCFVRGADLLIYRKGNSTAYRYVWGKNNNEMCYTLDYDGRNIYWGGDENGYPVIFIISPSSYSSLSVKKYKFGESADGRVAIIKVIGNYLVATTHHKIYIFKKPSSSMPSSLKMIGEVYFGDDLGYFAAFPIETRYVGGNKYLVCQIAWEEAVGVVYINLSRIESSHLVFNGDFNQNGKYKLYFYGGFEENISGITTSFSRTSLTRTTHSPSAASGSNGSKSFSTSRTFVTITIS